MGTRLDATRFTSANFELHEVSDFHAQHSYAKTAAQLLNAFPAKKNLNADVDPEDLLDVPEKNVHYAAWESPAENT